MPKISVIVPVYKVEAYLRPCIESILKQTFIDFELILVDDGSPDQCGAICDEYSKKDKRIFVVHKKNGGLSTARNAGLDLMKGEYVTFVDSDDIIEGKYLEVLFNDIQRLNAQISTCQMYEFIGEAILTQNYTNKQESLIMSGRDAVFNLYNDKAGITINACAKLYHKSLFKTLRFPEGKIHEDQARVPLLLYMAKKVVVNYGQAYGYRLRMSSIMHSKFSGKRYDDIEAIEECIQFFKIKQDVMLVNAAMKKRDKLLALYSLFARCDNVYKEVPIKYRMSQWRALKYLYNNLTDDQYTYQLAKVHPNWLLPHAYLRKIKKMLGLKVPD